MSTIENGTEDVTPLEEIVASEPAVPAKRSRAVVVVALVAVGLLLAVVTGLLGVNLMKGAGPAKPAAPVGFNDPHKLADAVKAGYQSRLLAGNYIESVTCIPAGQHLFHCVMDVNIYGQSQSFSHLVTVTADGTDWVADSQ